MVCGQTVISAFRHLGFFVNSPVKLPSSPSLALLSDSFALGPLQFDRDWLIRHWDRTPAALVRTAARKKGFTSGETATGGLAWFVGRSSVHGEPGFQLTAGLER
jgi:hypothetical protein